MNNPHQEILDEIKALTNERLVKKEIWDVIRITMPTGYADRIGSNLLVGGKPLSGNTIRAWGNNPYVDAATSTDPWGRVSPADLLERYLFSGLYPILPEGVGTILKWYQLRFAMYEAAQGRPEMLNAQEANDKARAYLEEAAKILRGNPTDTT